MPLTIYANPYNACDQCGQRTVGFNSGAGRPINVPCGHHGGFTSVCPSWGPVDGCGCVQPSHGVPSLPAGYPDPLDGRNR